MVTISWSEKYCLINKEFWLARLNPSKLINKYLVRFIQMEKLIPRFET